MTSEAYNPHGHRSPEDAHILTYSLVALGTFVFVVVLIGGIAFFVSRG